MCAICGIYRPGSNPDARRVESMRELMSFRGPDAAGLSVGDDWALGHRRLSVIDLSDTANQPMSNEDGSIEVVLNGEIYNFAALRPELERAGHRFQSRADTEVVVHGFEQWGLDGLLQRLRGMYAFAVVDKRRGEMHLARDPLGKKPLYFRHDGTELLFASSARALAAGLPRPPAIDVASVHDLLWHLYIPGPRTIFEGVEKLPGGHAVTFSRTGERHEFTYWRPDFSRAQDGIDEEEWLREIERALRTAVERRLVSDVPLGVLLSGGVDSSLVTAVAAKITGRLKTFSVMSADKTIDESRWALLVAEHCRTDHHVLVVDEDVRGLLPELVAAMGEPLGDASAANLFAISRVARRQVTVALTGDGGDEVFGGYAHFLAFHLTESWRPVFGSAQSLGMLGARALHKLPAPLSRAGTLLRLATQTPEQFFESFGRNLEEMTRLSLFSPDVTSRLHDHDPIAHYRIALAQSRATRAVDQVMEAQMRTLLQDDYLAKADIGTMAASLEGRAPLLDVDLVDLATRVPARVRFRGRQPKGLLRALARRHVPAAAIDRKKQGFVAPVGAWLRGPWRDLVDEVVLGESIERRGWFRRDAVEAVVAAQRRGRGHDYLIWTLLVLELWLRAALEPSAGAAAARSVDPKEVFAR